MRSRTIWNLVTATAFCRIHSVNYAIDKVLQQISILFITVQIEIIRDGFRANESLHLLPTKGVFWSQARNTMKSVLETQIIKNFIANHGNAF